MATFTQWVEAQLSTGIWTDLTDDMNLDAGVNIHYGIDGMGPTDCVAGSGTGAFALNNHAGNSGGQQGWYSPLHASKRAGWTFGIPLQLVFAHDSDAAQSVSSITLAGTTATVTTGAAHGYATNDYVKISGADQVGYNGTRKITVTGGSTFTVTTNSGLTTPATGTITCRKVSVKHRGRIREIDPEPGVNGPRRAHVVSYDGMSDLADADLREVALQTNKTEAELVTAVLDALPVVSQPVARDLDAGVDGYPYAFDELGSGAKALSVIKDVAVSAFALAFMKGDGTFRLKSRSNRLSATSAYTFSDNMHGLAVPAALEQVFNLVRVTIHQRTISASANEIIYTLPADASIEIAAGVTREVWTAYTDPNDRQAQVGGSDVNTTLVAGTDYAANSAADGSGSDVTADISATLTPFASTAKWTLINNGAATAYVRTLRIVGKALRDPGPSTFEATSAQDYGTRPITIDLKYQANAAIAQSYATHVEEQYRSLDDQIEAIEFIANASSDFLTQALTREPGDVVTITETVTGASAIAAVIHSVDLSVRHGVMTVTWGLAPANLVDAWIIEEAGSALGTNTTVGPF